MANVYTTKLGDTWDMISLACYGSELFVADLVQANWEHREVAVFSADVVLAVPEITAVQEYDINLPPWRRR